MFIFITNLPHRAIITITKTYTNNTKFYNRMKSVETSAAKVNLLCFFHSIFCLFWALDVQNGLAGVCLTCIFCLPLADFYIYSTLCLHLVKLTLTSQVFKQRSIRFICKTCVICAVFKSLTTGTQFTQTQTNFYAHALSRQKLVLI